MLFQLVKVSAKGYISLNDILSIIFVTIYKFYLFIFPILLFNLLFLVFTHIAIIFSCFISLIMNRFARTHT